MITRTRYAQLGCQHAALVAMSDGRKVWGVAYNDDGDKVASVADDQKLVVYGTR